jgi:enoyl-CoA hydratase
MLTTQIRDNIAFLTLNHSDKGNSFGVEEAKSLRLVLEMKKLKGLVFTGSGRRFFCTGGNLSAQAQAASSRAALEQQKKIRKALDLLSNCAIPTVAIINGDAFGGGVEVLSAFDHVICAPHAVLGFWQRRLGLSYGWGGGTRLLKRLSEQKLLHLALSASHFSAQEALRIGIIDELATSLFAEQLALDWISSVNAQPAFNTIKKWKPSDESKIFDKLWMNDRHKEVVQKHKR